MGLRRPERSAVGQHGHGIGAAQSCGEDGDSAAHDIPVRIALGHHAPRGFGGDEGRARREAACLLDPRPEFSQGAELGDGQELILIGGEAEEDVAAGVIETDAAGLHGAEIGERGGEREGQLLRLPILRRHEPAGRRRRRTVP